MQQFSFGSIATVQPASQVNYLKPYTINENVTIKKTEIKEGTNKDGRAWKSLVITFGNDEGIYNDSTFYFDENDPNATVRKEYDQPNGGKRETPSQFETFLNKVAAISSAFNPEGFKKLQEQSGKIRTCEAFMKAFKVVLDQVIDKNPTSMKLVGRNSQGTVYATLPKCTGIAQATDEKTATNNNVNVGDWYTWMTSPFGDRLLFSAYEQRQKVELENAKPTKMDEEVGLQIDGDINEEIDYSSLL